MQGDLRARRLGGAGVEEGGLGGGLGHGLQHAGAAAGHHGAAVDAADAAVLTAVIQGAVAAVAHQADIDTPAVYVDIAVGVDAVGIPAGGVQQGDGAAVYGDAGETAIGGLRAAGVDAVIGGGDGDSAVLHEDLQGLDALVAAGDRDAAAQDGDGGIAVNGIVPGIQREGRAGDM